VAQYYTVVSSAQTVRVISQTQVAPVEAIGIYTKPSSVYLLVLVPLASYQSGGEATYLEPPALLVEQLMGNDLGAGTPPTGNPLVSGAQFVQAQDSSGLLASFVDFTVYFQPDTVLGLPFTGIVRIPMTSLESFPAFEQPIAGGTPSELLLAELARLKKLAAS
jgi:hypothetical protein